MRVAQTYDDYITGKAACDDVISWAELFGRWLIQKKEPGKTVITVLPSVSYVDYYYYAVEHSGKLLLKDWKNSFQNGLLSSLELDLHADPVVRQWWDLVFFQDNNGIHYDGYYDDFRIAEKSNYSFSQFLSRIKDELAKIPISKVVEIYLPKSFIEHKPLLYILQSEYEVSVSPIPELPVDSPLVESFPGIVNNSKLVLNAGGGIPIEVLLKHYLTIQIPNESITLESPALPGLDWAKITSGNRYRFFSGGIEYFEVSISAETDLFGNVFLNVYEFGKKTKCIKIS